MKNIGKSILLGFSLLAFAPMNGAAQSNNVLQLDGKTNNLRMGMEILSGQWTLELWVHSDVNKRKYEEFLIGGGEYTDYSFLDNEPLKLVNGKLTAPKGNLTDTEKLDGNWHHVALSCDGKTTRLYRDGNLVAQREVAYPILPGTIGVGDGDGTFSGQLDEVRIWKTAVSGDVIKSWAGHSLSPEHPCYKSLYGYYPMEVLDSEMSVNWVGRGPLGYHLRNGRIDHNGNQPLAYITTSENPKFKPYEGAQRLFNAVAIQSEWDCNQGNKEQQMVKLRIAVQGAEKPMKLTGLDLNLGETTDLSDIEAVHVYSTGQLARSGERTALFGKKLQPQQKMSLQSAEGEGLVLQPGINYVLVTFDVADAAVLGHRLDVAIDKYYLDGTAFTPETTPRHVYQEVTTNNRKNKNILKALQWNIWHGGVHLGNNGQDRIIDFLKGADADLILMQEAYGIQHKASLALNYKMKSNSNSDNLALYTDLPMENSIEWREPFKSNPTIVTMRNGHRVIAVDLWIRYSYHPEYTWYYPQPNQNIDGWVEEDSGKALTDMRNIVEKDVLPNYKSDMSVLMSGDYNSFSHLDWTDRTAHLHYGYGKVDFPVSIYLQNAGFNDSFREAHPDEVARPEGSWAPIFGHSPNARMDFIYSRGHLRTIQSKMVRSTPEIDFVWPSDHGGVISVFEYVPYEASMRDDLTALLDKHLIEAYTDQYVSGDRIGACDPQLCADYAAAVKHGRDLVKNADATEAELKEAIDKLNKSFEAMKASLQMPRDGYFYIVSAHEGFKNEQNVEKAWYMDKDAVRWTTLDKNNGVFLFKLTKQEDGSFSIQNVKDKRYVNGFTSVALQNTVNQSFFLTGRGNFYIVNGTEKENGGQVVYHAQGHAEGEGVSGDLIGWYADYSGVTGSAWTLIEETDQEKIAEMSYEETQKKLTAQFNEELAKAQASYEKAFVTLWYIKEASQLKANSVEPRKGSLAALIDNDPSTYFHSNRRLAAVPYIEVTLPKAVQKISVYLSKRTQDNFNRPTKITVLGSNDAATFTEVGTLPVAPDHLPIAENVPAYRSSKALDMGAAYKYLRFRVDETNNKTRYFTLGEFNISGDGFPSDTENSIGCREDLKPYYDQLKAVIESSLQVNPLKATPEEVAALVEANKALDAHYPYTELVDAAVEKVEHLVASAVIADVKEALMGQCTDAKTIEGMKKAAEEAKEAIQNNKDITRAEINAQVAAIETSIENFMASVVLPEDNKWYFIKNVSSTNEKVKGGYIAPATLNKDAGLVWANDIALQDKKNVNYLWKFVAAGDNMTYYLQNVGSGHYMGEYTKDFQQVQQSDTAVAYKVEYVAGGQFTIQPKQENAQPLYAGNNQTVISWKPFLGNEAMWTMEVSDAAAIASVKTIRQNSSSILCLPYDINNDFYATQGSEVTRPRAFYVTGGKFDAQHKVTAVGLTSCPNGEVISAGTPFLLVCGNPAAALGPEMNLKLNIVYEGNVSNEAKASLGLVGALTETVISDPGLVYGGAGYEWLFLQPNRIATIPSQRGYINLELIKEEGTAERYLTLEDGTITGVGQVISTADTLVNVYSLTGQLVRSNVKRSVAIKGLKKGIYLVKGEKVLVP